MKLEPWFHKGFVMLGIHFPPSDIVLVGVIILVILVSICLELVTLSKAIMNRKVNERTYAMVHRVLGSQLLITSIAMKRVAAMSGHEDDVEAFTRAEEAYRDHMSNSH
jgi:hypothetical protein